MSGLCIDPIWVDAAGHLTCWLAVPAWVLGALFGVVIGVAAWRAL